MKIHRNTITTQKACWEKISSSLCAFVLINLFSFPLHGQSPKTWEWVRTFGGPGWDITGGASTDNQNNIYASGTFTDTLRYDKKKYPSQGQTDIFITRFTEKGKLDAIWTIGGIGADHATCLGVTTQGNIVLGGSITGRVTFGSITTNTTGPSLFITSMDKKGNYGWVTPITPTGRATLSYIGSDTLGNIYACGQYTDSLEAGGTTIASKGKTDVFVIKLGNSGNVEKLLTFGSKDEDKVTTFAVPHSGGAVIAGSFTKTFTIGTISINPTTGQKTNNYIARIDTSLTATWSLTPGSREYSKISSLRYSTNDSALYVSGSFSSTMNLAGTTLSSSGMTDGFLASLSNNGNLKWARHIGSARYDYIHHLDIDNLGGAIITGSIGDTITLDSLTIAPPAGGSTAFVAQFDTSGKATWADYLSGTSRNFGETVLLDKTGNLYVYGSYTGKFEKEDESLISKGDQDLYLARYYNCPGTKAEVNGNLQICPGIITELSVSSGYKNVTWNDTLPGRYFYTGQAGRYRVSMYDAKGCLYTDTVTVTQSPQPIFSLGHDTTVYTTSSIQLQAPSTYASYHWHDGSYQAVYVVRSPDGKPGKETCWLTVTDTVGCSFADTITITFVAPVNPSLYSNIKLNTWPNPVTGALNWNIETESTSSFTLQITDSYGRILSSQNISSYTTGQAMQEDVSRFPQGTYILKVNTNTGETIKTQGFVKQ